MKRLGVRLLILLGLVMISMSSQGKELHTPQANQQTEAKAIETSQPNDSLVYINEEIKANPEDPRAWVKLTLFYSNPNYELEDINELYEAIMKSISFIHKHPKRGNEAYAIWRAAYLPEKQRTKKLKALDKAIQKDPNNLDLYEQRANLYLSMDQQELAQVDFLQMIYVSPNDKKGYEALGELGHDNQSSIWASILTLAPTAPKAYYRASEYFRMSGSWDEAKDLAIEGLSRYGDDKDHTLYNHLCFLLSRSDSDDERLASKLQKEIRKHPKDVKWTLLLETLYTGPCQAFPEKAIRCLQDALKKVPKQNKTAYLSLIDRMPKNYVELGDLDSALMYLNMAIKIDPSFAGYHYNKATILHAFGDTRAAITELNNYFAHPNSDKNDTEAYYKRAYYKFEIKDLSGALADVKRAMAKDSHPNPSTYLLRGDIYAAQGKSTQAKADYKTVLENTYSGDPRTRIFALIGLGNKKQAMQILTDQINRYKEFDDLDDSNFYLLLRTLIAYGKVELARYFREISTEWGYPYPCVNENTRVVKNNPKYKELQKRGVNIL
ncbi:tetratricopeptide repeat protein [uncultured Porphyromonas sp.]|uniref:tetratricopeptide repeat protein n=1 Tax=uncultured Porphyromonas sp. TaxID=159274 RepID=UPI002615680E|nr:tetratricopeptide repeat protein [uncultured Porphyromonas sp.]